MKADFHIHSNYSDGYDSPEDIFKKASLRGIDLISITDHDILEGTELFNYLARHYNIKHINGMEISAYDYTNNSPCHIIGINIKEYTNNLKAMNQDVLIQRHETSKKQIKKLGEMGYDIKYEEVISFRGSKVIYKQHIMDVLIKKGYAKGYYDEFYKKMFKNKGPLDMRIEYPSSVEAVKLLNEAGAISILAHPTLYNNLNHIEELIKAGIKGIEYEYPFATQNDKEIIKNIAIENNLFLSGGSDYHGEYGGSSNSEIGNNTFELSELELEINVNF